MAPRTFRGTVWMFCWSWHRTLKDFERHCYEVDNNPLTWSKTVERGTITIFQFRTNVKLLEVLPAERGEAR